jgi:hypothetical protein
VKKRIKSVKKREIVLFVCLFFVVCFNFFVRLLFVVCCCFREESRGERQWLGRLILRSF